MSHAKIGRLLVASLHQAVGECLPTRLEFYEHWLDTRKLRNEAIGRAQLVAVFSFLRREDGQYAAVTALAGRYTADWTVGSWSGLRQASLRTLPSFVRRRIVLRMAARALRRLGTARRVTLSGQRSLVMAEVDDSIFCDPRSAVSTPLCGFFGSALTRFLEHFDVPADADTTRCRAVDGERCIVMIRTGQWSESTTSSTERA